MKHTPLESVIFRPDPSDGSKDRLCLNHLADNPGSHYRAKRLGRGIGSGKGKTSGKGHKGQNARSGTRKPHASFEGGQTPLFKRMRKFGFSNKMFGKDYDYVNLQKIQEWIDKGRIDPTQTITMKTLLDTKCVSKIKQGVKVLGRLGKEGLKQPITLEATSISQKARDAIDQMGGKSTTMYYNRLALRFLLMPEKFEFPIARAAAKVQERHKFDDWGQTTSPRHLKLVAYQEEQKRKEEARRAREQSSEEQSEQ